LWRKNILARHCSQIAAQENTLGRHYSRFQPSTRVTLQQYQPVAAAKNLKIAKVAVESANFG
jgi:hypothetical protein